MGFYDIIKGMSASARNATVISSLKNWRNIMQNKNLWHAYDAVLNLMIASLEKDEEGLGDWFEGDIVQYHYPVRLPEEDNHKLPFILFSLGNLMKKFIEISFDNHQEEIKLHGLDDLFKEINL